MNGNVITGVGLSGRDYLNRLLYLSEEETVFLDRDESLIRQLCREPLYTIRSGGEREPLKVDSYIAYTITDEHTITNVAQAERTLICVDTGHVVELPPFLQATLQERDRRSLDILVAENGMRPSSPLAVLCNDSRIHLSEAIIFHTTLGQRDSLAIFSENPDHPPYDSIALGCEPPLYGLVQETYFSDSLEREVYTYNCISACIAYLGYERGYTGYVRAMNDVEVAEKIKRIAGVVNRRITTVYNVPMQKQTAFSEMAIRKFQNRNIKDTVACSARDVKKKLKLKEGVRKLLSLMQEQGGHSRELLEVLAAALRRDVRIKELLQDWDELVGLYTQGMCEEWKQVLHRRK